MALDPLRFAIEIVDDATTKIESIQAQLKAMDSAIKITIDEQAFKSQLQTALENAARNLEAVKIEASKLTITGGTVGNAAEEIEKAKQAISGGRFGELAGRIKDATTNLNEFTDAMKKFQGQISQDQGMRDFMIGIGEVIRNVKLQLSQIQPANISDPLSAAQKSIQKARYELYEFNNLVSRAEGVSRLGKQFSDVDTKPLDTAIGKMREFKVDLDSLANGGLSRKGMRFEDFKIDAEFKEAVNQVKKLISETESLETSQRRYNTMLQETESLQRRLAAAANIGLMNGITTDNTTNAIARVEEFLNRIRSLSKEDLNNTHIVNELAAEYMKLASSASSAAKEQERLNTANAKANQRAAAEAIKQQAKAASDAAKEDKRWAESQNQASIEANKLVHKMRELKAIKISGKQLGIDTTELERNMAVMQNYLNKLFAIQNGVQKFGHTSDFLGEAPFKNAAFNADKAATNINRLAGDAQKAASATSQLTAEEQRLAQALNQTTEHARGQSQVLSDLKSMAMQYLSVWGGQQFLHNIIEIGGQLEMQRLSISAILGDAAQGRALFEDIKDLAIKSPFGVVELDQFTKQLSAYGFQANELFDMTKRLADIAAGAGTDVGRLALALGHVRAEGALSGYTLRQFAMNNIPMLQKLSDRLSEVEGKIVSTAEVRKRVRSKEIGYEEVVKVIEDLTNEGGMFFNMQEVISQSVKARFKNLKDSMDIMYGEMAENGAFGGSLKLVAEGLTKLTREWKVALPVIAATAAVIGTQRMSMLATNRAIVEGNLIAGKYTAKQMEMLASTGKLTKGKLLQAVATKKVSVADAEAAAATFGLTRAQLQHVANTGKVTSAMGMATVATSKFTVAQLRAMATFRSSSWLSSAKYISGFKAALGSATTAARGLGIAIKGLLKTTAILAVIDFAVGTIAKQFDKASESAERASAVGQKAQEGFKNMKDFSVGIKLETNMNEDDMRIQIDSMVQQLKEYSPQVNRTLKEVFRLDDTGANLYSVETQYQMLKREIDDVTESYQKLALIKDVAESANKKTGGKVFWNDSFRKNVKDYVNSINDVRKAENDFLSNTTEVWAAVEDTMKKSDVFRQAVENNIALYNETGGKQGFREDDIRAQVKLLEEYKGLFETSYGEFGGNTPDILKQFSAAYENFHSQIMSGNQELSASWTNYIGAVSEADGKQKEMLEDGKVFMKNLISMSEKEFGKTWQNFTRAEKLAVQQATQEFLNGVDGFSDMAASERHEIENELLGPYKITIDVDAEEAYQQVNALQSYLRGITDKTWTVKINTINTFTDVIDQTRKAHKENTEDMKKLEKSVKGYGYNIKDIQSGGSVWLEATLKNEQRAMAKSAVKEYWEAYQSEMQNKKVAQENFFSLEDESKKKNKNKSKSGSKKAYKDPDVEKWKERMRNIREAYREYEKWEKKVGHAEAIARIKREFSGLVDEKTLDDIKNYRKEIEKIRNDAQARYNTQKKDKSKDYGKQAQQLVRDSEKALNEIDLGVFDRAAEKFKSDMERTLSELSRKWEVFTNVRNATGNETTASILAGFGENIPEAKDVAAAFKEYLQAEIAKMGDEVTIPIRFDQSMSKQEVEDMVKAALGGTKYKEQIEAITDGIQKWIELSKDAEKKAVDAYTSAMTKAMDYASQIARINAELAEQNRLIDQNNNLSKAQKDKAKSINQANASMKRLEVDDSYKRFFNNVFTETKTELEGMAKVIKSQLNYSLNKGAITAEEYAKKIKEIDDVMKQSEISNPEKWYNKGIFNTESMEQRNQRKANEGNELIQNGANMLQEGLNSGDGDLIARGREMKEAGQNMVKGANQAALTMAIIDKVVHGVDQSIQGTVKAFDYLKEALDAIGVESDTMSTVGDYLHTLGEMSSHVTSSWDNFKNGNFVGASVEAIGAVTSVIKGIAQAHDNRLERAIERLRDDVKSIESNTELIVRSRERTLGYDTGDVRRQMAQQYAQQSYGGKGIMAYINSMLGGSRQNKSMFDYYSQNSQGTGYQQEYSNLVEQREKYMEILKDQQDKKKKSNSEIEETKSKIAELDDQIRYFTQDLAKELWGIDIKGWADQLSDALASAFENGENMAKAYKDTVTSIIQQMMQKMMQMAILEPMFERLQKQLFGENGKGGVFDPNNPKGSMSKVTKIIGDYFGKGGEGEKAITASMEFMTAFQRAMQNAGLTVLNEASNTLSSSMQGTTEETSGLLAGYVNALRQDVSVNRILLTQYVTQLWPQYVEAFTAQVTSVTSIDNNVRIIMEMMQMGNGAMFDEIAAMRTRIDNIVTGIDRVSIR